MSVPVNQRTQSKLEVNLKAHDLCVYTLQITKNKKIFTVEYQDALTDRIIDASIEIHTLCWQANNIRVTDPELLQMRLILQEQAAVKCNELMALIELAKKVFHLSAKRAVFWTSKVIEVRRLIRAWKASDAKRYGDQYNGV